MVYSGGKSAGKKSMSPPLVEANTAHKHAIDNDWALRGDFWNKKLNPVSQYKTSKRRIIHKPLVLSGHGIRLNVDYRTTGSCQERCRII
jgi:hypothetical protein